MASQPGLGPSGAHAADSPPVPAASFTLTAERYEHLVHHLHSGVVVHAADTSILFANQRASELLGLTIDQMLGKEAIDPAWSFVREDGSAMPLAEYPVNLVVASGEPLRDYLVGVNRPPAGDRVWVLCNAFPELGADGELRQVVVTFVDITRRKEAEEALRLSEARYRRLHDSMRDAFVSVEMAGRIQETNQAYRDMLGYTADELARLTYQDLTPEAWHAQEAEIVAQQIVPRGYSDVYEKEYRRKDGVVFPVELRAFLVTDEHGQPAAMWAIVRDITERRRADEALRASEERQRSILHAAMDGFWRVDLRGRLIEVNEAYCRMIGYGEQELLSLGIADLEANERPEEVAAHIVRVIVEGQGRFETRHRRKDGSLVSVEISVQYKPRDDGYMVAFIRDISAQQEAEQALRASEEKYRALVETTGTGFLILDHQGRVADANPEYVRLTGHQHFDEIVGRSVIEWTAARDQERHAAAVQQCLADRQIRDLEIDYVWPDGRIVPVEINATVQGEGDQLRIVSLCRDITERERLRADLSQAQKMESVGRLAGGVAHDFNNMLQAILGNAALALLDVPPGSPVRESLDEIRKSAERSAELTKQLLAFARKQVIAPRVLDLNDTVAGMLKMLRRLIGEHIHLAWLPGAGLRPVRIDPSQVDQLLVNLCVNARDAITGTGTITLATEMCPLDPEYAAAHPELAPGDYVVLAVSDSGAGIDERAREHLFEPFFTTKGVGQGTGLGLATVFGIVKQNGGAIEVSSELGQGTTFRLHFPSAVEELAPAAGPAAGAVTTGGGETVLLVEDEEQILELAARVLAPLGYTVLTALTPAAALAQVERHDGPLDLLVTDVVMPGMNGRELRDRVAALKPGLRCLFISGYTADVVARQGVVEEDIEFLQKPFALEDLARKVAGLLAPRG